MTSSHKEIQLEYQGSSHQPSLKICDRKDEILGAVVVPDAEVLFDISRRLNHSIHTRATRH
jgi:hypothetical protein